MNDKVLNFIYKFFFILKAASDGWIVNYLGANEFEFYIPNKKWNKKYIMQIEEFVKKYFQLY